MDISDFYNVFLGWLIGAAPALAFWIAVIIFAIIMLRRGGGRAERFLMAGAIIKIIGNLLNIPMAFFPSGSGPRVTAWIPPLP